MPVTMILWFLMSLGIVSLIIVDDGTGDSSAGRILAQARSERDLPKRIALIDEALKDQSLKGKMLSALFFERAMAYKHLGDCFKAIQDFDSAFAHYRGTFPALIEKAECLLTIDQIDEASRILELHLLSRPNSVRGYVLKGMIFEKEGFLTKAEDEYARALYYEPQSVAAMEARARVRLRMGNSLSALEDVSQWLKISPRNKNALLLRAQIQTKLKNYAMALEDYNLADEIAPHDETITKEKIEIHLKTNQPERVIELLDRNKISDDGASEWLVYRARAFMLMKRVGKAEELLMKAVTVDEANASSLVCLAEIRSLRQDHDGALEHLNRALELDPKLVEAYKQRAAVFLELSEPARAASDLFEAAKLDPADGEIFLMRGLSYSARRLYEAASADFSRAIEMSPGDPRPLFQRALCSFYTSDLNSALGDLNSILRKKPDHPKALNMRGLVHFRLGQFAQAAQDFERSVALDPNNHVFLNNRGFFSFKIGKHEDALQDFLKALSVKEDYAIAQINIEAARNRMSARELLRTD